MLTDNCHTLTMDTILSSCIIRDGSTGHTDVSGTHCYLRGEHWLWGLQVGCCVVMSITSMLPRRVWLSSPNLPTTIRYVLHVVTPVHPLGGHHWYVCHCQPYPVHVLTKLVMVPDDASRPPMITSWLFMATADYGTVE